ncbi:MAG: HEAT repeat domain-containing protein [Candidatus Omnitrophica bacterium]|nr:HEAT repeat domain-containing protein [Candidatus Omnitrophota bacterium]
MQRFIELKHVGPKEQVRTLIEELVDRLEHKLHHFRQEALSVHILFDENGSHTLYHTSLTCHIPGHTVAAREESHDAGQAIRKAFKELERQLEKHTARLRPRPRPGRWRGKRTARGLGIVGVVMLVSAGAAAGWAQDAGSLSPEAQQLVAQLDAQDAYVRQQAFLRLEALREPATADVIRRHLASRNQETRAFSVRALAAVEGAAAVPTLVERLTRERSWNVRLNLVLALEPLADQSPAVMPALIRALRDRKAEVRMAAVDAVSRLDHPDAREAIRLRWRRERHRDVRRVLERAMARLGDADGSAPPQGS